MKNKVDIKEVLREKKKLVITTVSAVVLVAGGATFFVLKGDDNGSETPAPEEQVETVTQNNNQETPDVADEGVDDLDVSPDVSNDNVDGSPQDDLDAQTDPLYEDDKKEADDTQNKDVLDKVENEDETQSDAVGTKLNSGNSKEKLPIQKGAVVPPKPLTAPKGYAPYGNGMANLQTIYPDKWFYLERTHEGLPVLQKAMGKATIYDATKMAVSGYVPIAEFYPKPTLNILVTLAMEAPKPTQANTKEEVSNVSEVKTSSEKIGAYAVSIKSYKQKEKLEPEPLLITEMRFVNGKTNMSVMVREDYAKAKKSGAVKEAKLIIKYLKPMPVATTKGG